MGEVLTQVQSNYEMSELFDKQVNVQKESLNKHFRDLRKLLQAHEKVCDENETKKERKNDTGKNVFDIRKLFLRHIQTLVKTI